MADQDINIRVNTSQSGPGLKPVIKETEELAKATKELTKAQEAQSKVLTGASGLASSVTPSAPAAKKAVFTRKELDRIADQKHAEEETARREEAKRQSDFEDAAEKALSDQQKADRQAAAKGVADAAEHAKKLARQRQLSAKSDERAGRSVLAKELAANVASETEGGASGGNLRTALRQGAQVAGLQSVGRALASLAGPLGYIVAAFAAVAAGVKVAIVSMKAFVEERAKIRELNQALAVSGNLSGALSQSVNELAKARAINSGISDDKWLTAYEQLLRSGASANQLGEFSDKLSALKVITGSFEQASNLLTGALKGQFDGFKELGIFIPQHATQVQKLDSLYRQLGSAIGILENSLSDGEKSFAAFKSAAHSAGVGLGGFLVQLLHGPIDRWTKSLAALSSFTNQYTIPDIEKDQKARSKLVPIIYDQARATQVLNEQLEGQKLRMAFIEEVTNRMVAADKRAADAKKTAIDLEKEARIAMIDSAEERGQISHVTASLDRLQVNRQTEIQKLKIDQAQKDKEIADKQMELDSRRAGGGVRQASWNYEHAKFLLGDETNPQRKAELEGNVEEMKKRLDTARAGAPGIRELQEEIRKLKEEKSQGFRGTASHIAAEDIRDRTGIYRQHQDEVEAYKQNPQSRITPLTNAQMGVLNQFQKLQSMDAQYNDAVLKAMQLLTDFKEGATREIQRQASVIARQPRN